MNDGRRGRFGDRDEERFNDYLLFRRLLLLQEDAEEDGGALNPPRITYYLGRGRRGNNSKLIRAFVRIIEDDNAIGP